MASNRRNYYRILHVQPEAPVEIIRASYRTLMGTLRGHPDLGGNHETAAMINEAYEVLSDPARRAAYDHGLQQRTQAARRAGAELVLRHCPICAQPLPATIRPDTRCTTCGSPLAQPPRGAGAPRELFGRRGSVRRERTDMATAWVGWPAQKLTVRWRDISHDGLSFFSPRKLPARQAVRIVDDGLEVVASVVGCRTRGSLHTVHARLLTVLGR